MLFNGRVRTVEDVKAHAGYVQQSDHFMPFLTVFETLHYVARLRMPEKVVARACMGHSPHRRPIADKQ